MSKDRPEAPGPDGDAPAQPAPPLTGSVTVGLLWVALNTAATKLVSFGAQVVLAALLSPHDFGVFALCTSIALLTTILRDGGLRQVLIQRGQEYETLAGPLFWLAFTMNAVAGGLLIAAIPLASSVYHQPQLPLLLTITAVALPLGTPGAVLSARLTIQLRFKALSLMQTGSGLVRYGGSVLFAYLGLGALSFVLPLPIIALTEWLVCYALTRSKLWSRPPETARWRGLFNATKWVMVGTFATGLSNTGVYLVLGATVPTAVIGVYFFAFQVVTQVGNLLAGNGTQVLFPALAKLRSEPERQRAAALRALRTLVLLGAPSCLAVAVAFAPAERLIWHGRWAAAVLPVQIMSVCFPMNIALGVPMSLQFANGAFRQWALMILVYGVGMVVGGSVGAWIAPTATAVALSTGVFIVVGTFVYMVPAFRGAGISVASALRATVPAWALCCAAAGIAMLADHHWLAGVSLLVRLAVTMVTFGLLLAAGLRILLPGDLREALAVVPTRARGLVRRAMCL